MTSLKEWIDAKINDGDITKFEYSELSNIVEIGKGGFGVVHRADLDNRGIQVALKSFSNKNRKIDKDDVADLVKELKLLRIVHYHPNINNFIGITNGSCKLRETPIENTPLKYQILYQKCWSEDPTLRPDINEVYTKLKQLDAQFNSVKSDDDIINEERELCSALMEIRKSYMIYNDTGPTKSLDFDSVIDHHRPRSEAIFDYLINDPTIEHYDVMIGIFHYHYSEFEKHEKYYQWVKKASDNGDIYGHYELGRCYYHGYGIESDKNKAIELFERSGLNIALYSLADHHNQCGNLQEAFELYVRSAEKGYVTSQHIVGECYYHGKGPQKDKEIALKWYTKYRDGGGINDVGTRIKDLVDFIDTKDLAISIYNFLKRNLS
ncbi:16531_t:CDS:2 [Funneliformis caledonium]|uniref:16531_t:CDS:1 n=1 Tax=Funneliformis caledonium TaxID=1117310 RepID=A0A9N8WMA5_9GLOM|nr:16531_t:CDS:2 [Funneliformis caledonium]